MRFPSGQQPVLRARKLYTYVGNNPISRTDPSGLVFISPDPGIPDDSGRIAPTPYSNIFAACKLCMQSVAAEYTSLPANDKYKHCMVGAKGAKQCSQICAVAAAIGKEIIDLTDGNPNTHPEVADAMATFDGIGCGSSSGSGCGGSAEDCCKKKGHNP